MDTTLDNMQLKRAWQTAFELRLCPDGDTLFAEVPDEKLERHLHLCHVCRDKRDMPLEQRTAWLELMQRLAVSGQQPARPDKPMRGQVWAIKQSLAGWGEDGYFYKPPTVLLLEKIEGSCGFKAVQLYGDRVLMGEGDTWLDDRFGFAQGWNCYTIHEDALDGCWGAVSERILDQVLNAVVMSHAPVEEDSILYFFRRMELNVGARVALPSVAVLVEEWEAEGAQERELVPGLTAIIGGARQIGIRITGKALDAIRATFAPQPTFVTRGPYNTQQAMTLPVEVRELLQCNFPLVLIDAYIDPDGLKLKFRKMTDNLQLLTVSIVVAGEPVNAQWQSWETTCPVLIVYSVPSLPLSYEIRLENDVLHVRLGGRMSV